eukprot:scaffold8735_cov12-Prasinocladus_malaysianus.AAC.1
MDITKSRGHKIGTFLLPLLQCLNHLWKEGREADREDGGDGSTGGQHAPRRVDAPVLQLELLRTRSMPQATHTVISNAGMSGRWCSLVASIFECTMTLVRPVGGLQGVVENR